MFEGGNVTLAFYFSFRKRQQIIAQGIPLKEILYYAFKMPTF